VSALTTAVDAVVQRHDALRATIDEDGATLVVAPELKVALEHIDLSARADSERDAELDRLLDTDARTAFDLANGPLIRGFLVKMAANEHVLVLTMHHIVCDGWSCNVILGDLAEIYSAAVEQRGAVLDPVMSFAAFARGQAARSRSEQADMEAYWLGQFETVPPLVELPTDRPREDARTYNGTTHRRHIAKEQLERIRQLGTRHGASLFATLFAGFNALVMRLSGQSDVVVGVPTAGQSLLDGGALVGHCVNFLPIRTAMAPTATFAELLAQVKETVLDAYDHQDFTYGTLVQRLDIKRDPSRLPLTELQFNLEQVGSGATFAGLASAVEANAKGAVNSDLFLNIVESADGLALDCDYNTDLFDAKTIDVWLTGLETLLMGAAADPAQSISALPVPEAIARKENAPLRSLTAADFDRLAAWNATDAAYPKESSVVALFEAQVARTPQAVALTQGEVALSYADLNEKANRLANYLIGLGAGPGQLVGVCLDRTPEMLVALLAVLKSGAAYLPLDPTYPSDRIAFMLEDGQAKLLVTQQQHAGLVPQVNVTRVLMDGDRMAIAARSAGNPSVPAAPDGPAYVIYTSGSTGKPKGVAVPHRALVNFLHSMQREPGLMATDVLAAVTTISFDIAGLELYLPLITGARIELVTRDAAADGAQLVQVLEASGATVLQATPATWRLLIDAGWTGSKSLRALCGGEALPRDLAGALLQRVGQLWNMYGPTETTIWSTVERVESAEGVITIGRPIANTQIHILDEAGQHLPVGVDGEIWIGGDGVAIGYRGRPELTEERFVPDRFSGRENARLYRTGDYGRWLEDGRLQHLGRVDHQVKIRGYRIELEEIEAVLQQVPGVKQACVVAEKDGEIAGRLVAFCIPVAQGSLVLEKILAHLKQHLPSFMVPASFVNVDSFPLTANGKLDRLKLLEIEHQRRAERVQVAAESAEEQKLLDIVKEVMRLDRIGVTDNLFEIGADSLRIFQIASRAAKAGLALTPRAILQGRTIRAALAQAAAAPAGASAGLTIKPAVRQRVRLVPVAGTNGTTKS
jgi:amino acid adenylation domain-containing protein